VVVVVVAVHLLLYFSNCLTLIRIIFLSLSLSLSQPTFERTDSQPQSTFEPTDLLASASIESSKLSFNEVRERVMLLFG